MEVHHLLHLSEKLLNNTGVRKCGCCRERPGFCAEWAPCRIGTSILSVLSRRCPEQSHPLWTKLARVAEATAASFLIGNYAYRQFLLQLREREQTVAKLLSFPGGSPVAARQG